MSWNLLFAAGLLEIVWAVGLKYTEGFSKLVPSVVTLGALIGSVVLLAFAAKSLPIGTAYAVWTGIGAVGAVICGMVFLGDPVTWSRLICLGLVIIGIIGLKVF